MSTPHIHILLVGGSGRMGQRIAALASGDSRCRIVGTLARGAAPLPRDSSHRPSVVVDFSSPEGAVAAAGHAVNLGVPIVSGTTGLEPAHLAALRAAGKHVAVLHAPNMSAGVAAVSAVIGDLARRLGPDYQCSIVEAHHAAKKDAPSGTAKRLAEAVRAGGGNLPADQVLAMRGGDVIGEHTVRFAGPGEYIEVTHRATNRDLFALGALRAAQWIVGKQAGWYTIENVVHGTSG